MENTMPNSKINRWVLLALISAVSVSATYLIISNFRKEESTKDLTNSVVPSVVDSEVVESQMFVSIESDYKNGSVNIYVSSQTSLTGAELLFNLGDGVKFNSISENDLFADYWTSEEKEGKVLRIAGTGGALVEPVNVSNRSLFAKINLNGLTNSSGLVLDLQGSSALDSEQNPVSVKLEYK